MKKIISILCLLLVMTGCGSNHPNNNDQKFIPIDQPKIAKNLAYDRFYLIGDSLSDIRSQTIKVVMNFSFCCIPLSVTEELRAPDPKAYYKNRYCNGRNFFDYLKELMPELPIRDEDNVAYQGSGSFGNIIGFYTQEGIDDYLGSWKNWVTSIVTTPHPGFDAQFDQVVAKETALPQLDRKKPALAFIWSGGMHNDIMSLPYLAGYKNQWTKLPQMADQDVVRLQMTLTQIQDQSGKKMQANIQKLYDVGIRDVVFFEGLPIHLTPHFMDLKRKYQHVPGFATFIDSMADSYNQTMKNHLDAWQANLRKQGKQMNITYLSAKDLVLDVQDDDKPFVNDKGERNGEIYDLMQANEDDRKTLSTTMFYDPIHLTSNGAYKVATYVAAQLRKKEPNIKKCQASQK